MDDVRNMVGHEVRGWHIFQYLDQGADGIVYLGRKNETVAAIKLFFPESIEDNGIDGHTERLELQLSLIGEKHHQNLVEIFEGDFIQELNTIYIAMEYIPGKSLDKVLKDIPRELIPSLAGQLASAARFLDERGLAHRDIKPANIVVSDDFCNLTLLDLGIVYNVSNSNDEQRKSGDEFVASLRYSPPEFVWRDEAWTDSDAWKAITFYQIGATIHDMIMQRPLFSGMDTPRAKLYDAVKLVSPEIESPDCPTWLLQAIKACLVKNWQERIKLLSWDSFYPPTQTNSNQQIQAIRLKQIRKDELEIYNSEKETHKPKHQSNTELWNLQSKLFLMTRNFLISASIFPKFSGTHGTTSENAYEITFIFEKDSSFMFEQPLKVSITIKPTKDLELTTDITIIGIFESSEVFKASWSEMLTPESAESLCQNALLEIADRVTSGI